MEAAFSRFSRYGYRHTSMEEIARAADLSRPALYTYFRNKEEVFRALARDIQQRALRSAIAAARGRGTIETRIRGALEAKLASFFEIVKQAPHASELLDENNRICGDISTHYQRKYQTLLSGLIRQGTREGILAPRALGLSAASASALIISSAEGLETASPSPTTRTNYRRRLAALVRVFVTAMRTGCSGEKPKPSQ